VRVECSGSALRHERLESEEDNVQPNSSGQRGRSTEPLLGTRQKSQHDSEIGRPLLRNEEDPEEVSGLQTLRQEANDEADDRDDDEGLCNRWRCRGRNDHLSEDQRRCQDDVRWQEKQGENEQSFHVCTSKNEANRASDGIPVLEGLRALSQ